MDIEQQDVLSPEPVIEDLEDEIGIPTVLLYETDAPIDSSEDLPISTKEGNKFSLIQFLGRISINLILPFINGMMLGFGELIAHEIGFHYNWVGARVYPTTRVTNRKTQLL